METLTGGKIRYEEYVVVRLASREVLLPGNSDGLLSCVVEGNKNLVAGIDCRCHCGLYLLMWEGGLSLFEFCCLGREELR